jgi:hypothetical protein
MYFTLFASFEFGLEFELQVVACHEVATAPGIDLMAN